MLFYFKVSIVVQKFRTRRILTGNSGIANRIEVDNKNKELCKITIILCLHNKYGRFCTKCKMNF